MVILNENKHTCPLSTNKIDERGKFKISSLINDKGKYRAQHKARPSSKSLVRASKHCPMVVRLVVLKFHSVGNSSKLGVILLYNIILIHENSISYGCRYRWKESLDWSSIWLSLSYIASLSKDRLGMPVLYARHSFDIDRGPV